MIHQAVAVINGKGGTLKTTISANLAGILAVAGYRILLIGFDVQPDVLRDLGLHATDVNDQGARLAAALTGQARLAVSPTGRDRLDIVSGGDVLETVDVEPDDLDNALADVADDYDLIIIDCSPGNRSLQVAALNVARFVVIPTRADDASLDGLGKIARLFAETRSGANPDLEMLGVVLADIGSQSRRILRETREHVAELFGDENAMLLSTIRHAEAPSFEARKLGRLAHELDRETYSTIAAGQLPGGGGAHRYPASAPGVAGDHQRLAAEILQRISDRVPS